MLIEFLKPDFEFIDSRGSLVQLIREGYKQVNVIHSKANVIRGQHFHKLNSELFYVVSGEFVLTVNEVGRQTSEVYTMNAGKLFLIPPNIVHSFKFTVDTCLVSMYDKGVEIEGGAKDIHAVL